MLPEPSPLLRSPVALSPLIDPFGRSIRYLRISVTPYCNFRCLYCQPDGPHLPEGSREEISPREWEQLVTLFARMGVEKVRLSGGEPTLRKDLVKIVSRLSKIEGIGEVSLSTHAMHLAPLVDDLASAGLSRVNVSLDTLNADRFREISGRGDLSRVIEGVDAALAAGLDPIKLNAVPMKGINDHEIGDFLDFSAERGLRMRFIELMPVGVSRELYETRRMSGDEILERMQGRGSWKEMKRQGTDGPARMFQRESDGLRVGIIHPLGKNFCDNCNRVRLTHRGEMRGCLFGAQNVPLRHLLESDDWERDLEAGVRQALLSKPEKHRLEEGDDGELNSLAQIGG